MKSNVLLNVLSNVVTFKSSNTKVNKGAFNNYVDKMRGGRGQKMSVFVHA